MLLPVPRANHRIINAHVDNSNPNISYVENAASTHNTKLKNTFTLIVYLPVNFLYAGLAKFTTDVMIVDITTSQRNTFVIIIYYKNIKLINQ